MAPTAVVIFLITLFTQTFSAPNRCVSCQIGSNGWVNQENLSQRSANLEDLTQQAETEQIGSHNQLAFDDGRPGNWTDVNHYRTPDGHGRVFEEQGQRVDGSKRIRFYRKNFTFSHTSGNSDNFGATDLTGFNSAGRQDSSRLTGHRSYDQTQSSAYDQSAIRRTDSGLQNALHSREGFNGHTEGSGAYQNRDSSGRFTENISGYNGQSTQHGLTAGDQVRPENWRTVNTYRTDGGNGRVYEERGQYVSGPSQVRFFKKNYTSTYTSGGGLPTQDLGIDDINFERQVQRLQQQTGSHGTSQTLMNGGNTVQNSRYQTTHGHELRPGNFESQNQNTLGSNFHQQTTRVENQHASQFGSNSGSELEQGNRRDQNLEYSTGTYGNSNGYDSRRTQGVLTLENSGSPRQPHSESQTLEHEHRRRYGSQSSGQSGISNSGLNNQQQYHQTESYGTGRPSGQMRHYQQFQTSSHSSSINHPGIDVDAQQYGSDQETQQTLNTHDSFDQTNNGNSDRTYRVQNGRLVTHGFDLGQVAQGADCTDGTSGYTSFDQSQSHRVYKRVSGHDSQSQQVEDLTQQTEDLTQQTEDLTQQTEDLTQQTEDLTQQTQHFGQESWRPSRLELESQRVQDLTQQTEDLTQQTQDLTQQTEDLTQQTEDLTQQTQHFGQESWRPGKLELESQQVQDLTQQTEDLTQQTQDLTQQTEDLTQQTEDLTQQTQHFGQESWRPGKLELESQQVQDLTQQTEDLTQQTQDLTQQTEDLTQQTEDLTQQTQHFGQESWRPGKLELESQQTEDLTQQTEDLTQQTEDLTQQTEDLTQQTQHFGQESWKPGKLELESQQTEDLTQQTEDLTQQTEDLTQQTEDLTQQTEDLTQQTQHFGQESWKPGKLELESQQTEDLTQQTQDLTQQTEDLTQQTEDLTQQTEDLTQQTQDLTQQIQRDQSFTQQTEDLTQQTEDLTQQTEDLTQQSEDLTQQTEDLTQQTEDIAHQTQYFQQESQRPGKLELESQHVQDLTQQTEDLTQQTEDLTQQTEDLTQQSEDLTQQTEDLTQQTEDLAHQTQHFPQESRRPGELELESQHVQDLTQQTEDLTQQIEDLTQQTEDLTQQTQHFGQESWRPGKLELESQQVQDLTQQTEDLTQQTEDLTQQTQDLTQQTEDLTQQTQHFGQESWRPGKLELASQQVQDLTQQTEDLTQQTEDLTQQTQDLTQQTEDLTQQTQHFGEEYWRPGKLELESQQTEDLTQQTEDLTQQTQDLTQQTEDLTQQTEDLTQQTQDLTQQTEDLTQQTQHFGQESWRPGKLELESQRTEDLTQQTEDLTQQTEDLTQQTEDLTQQTQHFGQESLKPGNLELESQQVQDFTQQSEDLTQQTIDLTQQTEDLTQQTEDLTQQTQDLTQQIEDFSQQTGNINDYTDQTTGHQGFGQETSWNSPQFEIASQQSEDLNQGNAFSQQQPSNNPHRVTRPTPKPAPKPKRPRPLSSHRTQQLNVELEETTLSNADKYTTLNNEHTEKTLIPPMPHRGDQGIDYNGNEAHEKDIQVVGVPTELPEQQTQHVSRYPDSFNQQTTNVNQFRPVQPTKTKTSQRRRYQNQPQVNQPWEGPRGWTPPSDVTFSQGSPTRYVDRSHGNPSHLNLVQSTTARQITPEYQEHWVNTERSKQIESAQTRQNIQHVGSAIQSRQQPSGESDRIVFPDEDIDLVPRILEAYGAHGPYGTDHDSSIFDSAKENPGAVLIPPDGDEAFIINPYGRITTTTVAPTLSPITTTSTTTTTTTTTTPAPTTTTEAPSFWRRVGNSLSNTYDKAKEKAKEMLG